MAKRLQNITHSELKDVILQCLTKMHKQVSNILGFQKFQVEYSLRNDPNFRTEVDLHEAAQALEELRTEGKVVGVTIPGNREPHFLPKSNEFNAK